MVGRTKRLSTESKIRHARLQKKGSPADNLFAFLDFFLHPIDFSIASEQDCAPGEY